MTVKGGARDVLGLSYVPNACAVTAGDVATSILCVIVGLFAASAAAGVLSTEASLIEQAVFAGTLADVTRITA